MMRYGIFSMRWASALRGSVSGSGHLSSYNILIRESSAVQGLTCNEEQIVLVKDVGFGEGCAPPQLWSEGKAFIKLYEIAD